MQFDPSLLPDDFLEDLPDIDPNELLVLDSSENGHSLLELDANDLAGGLGVRDCNAAEGILNCAAGVVLSRKGESPSTSESGNRNPGSSKPTSAGGESSGGHPLSSQAEKQPCEDESKRLARMQRNRENAFLSRQRKKQQLVGLQQQCMVLRTQAAQTSALVQRLVAENCLLRHHLQAACTQAGIPIPDVPSALKSATAAASQAVPNRVPVPAVSVVPSQHISLICGPKPAFGPQQGTSLPSQPSGFKVTTVNSAVEQATPRPPAITNQQTRGRKRARMTGASAAFLAMFSIFMFVAPIMPTNKSHVAPNTALPAVRDAAIGLLPSAISMENKAMLPGGHGQKSRTLLAVEDDASLHPRPSVSSMAVFVNQTLEDLLRDPKNQGLGGKALQQLQELAPAAVVLESDQGSKPANPLAASFAFPFLAREFLRGSGLDAPQSCSKVFEFAAAALPNAARSKRQVEKFVTGSYGFKGRNVGGLLNGRTQHDRHGAAALQLSSGQDSPVEQPGLAPQKVEQRLLEETTLVPLRIGDHAYEEDAVDGGGGGMPGNELQIAVDEPTLVSILLPANASESNKNGLSAIDRVFVVLLHPGERFVTYSCGLSRPLLA